MSNIIYQPNIMMFYGINGDNDYKISPAPNMSISVNMKYSGDTIIGYNYTLTLNGTITSLDLSNLNYGDSYDPESLSKTNISSLADSIIKLRKILNQNGNILYIVDAENFSNIYFKAKGGKLISLNINPSENNWVSTAPFSATIEFDTIEIKNTENCSTPLFDSGSFPSAPDGIVDLGEYKLKSFNDSWSFDFPESMYDKFSYSDFNNSFLNINNVLFTIQYQIQAVGQNYYIYSNEDSNSTANLTPAWLQAKNFVQKRMHSQVTNLINSVLKTYSTSCNSSDGLDDINIPGNTSNGLLSSLGDTDYTICNETINCESSESDGSFSATYNAIICSNRGNNNFSSPKATHTVQKSTNIINDFSKPEIRLTLNGSIQGMIEGGLVRINEPLELPSQGSLFIKNSQTTSKYSNALNLFNNIFSHSDYGGGIGANSKKDIKQYYKDMFGINASNLNITPSPDDTMSNSLPHPVNFTLTEDRTGGIINYSIEYSNIVNRCGRKYNSVTIDSEEPTKVYAVLEIPGGGCAIVQKLGTFTARKINIAIEGKDDSDIGKPEPPILLQSLIMCADGDCQAEEYLPITIPVGSVLTQRQYTFDPINGTFQINLSYICYNEPCPI